MSEKAKLHMPYIAAIPYAVLVSRKIKDADRVYFAVLAAIAKGEGYVYATNEQLADLFEVDIKTIERRNKRLRDGGFLTSNVYSVQYRDDNGRLLWKQKRDMYIAEAFCKKNPDTHTQTDTDKNEDIDDTDKNEDIDDTDNFGGSYESKPFESKLNEERKRRAKPSVSDTMLSFGNDGVVKLTETQHARLKEQIPDVDEIIEEINDYIVSKGAKPYKDYAAAIRNWNRRRKKEAKTKSGKSRANPNLTEEERSQYDF